MSTTTPGAASGWGGIAASGVGAAASTYAAYSNAKGEKQNLEWVAKMQERDARMAELRAADRQAVGNEQLFKLRLQQKQHFGAQRARIAAKGGSLTEGSHLFILQDSKWVANLEAENLKSNTDKEVFALKNTALNKAFASDMSRINARQISPGASAAEGLISGAAKFSSAWNRYKPYTAERGGRAAGFLGRDSQDSAGAEYQ